MTKFDYIFKINKSIAKRYEWYITFLVFVEKWSVKVLIVKFLSVFIHNITDELSIFVSIIVILADAVFIKIDRKSVV